MKATPFPIFLPNKGIKLDSPSQFLQKNWSPYSRNMEFNDEELQGRGGLELFDTTVLSGPILGIKQFWHEDRTFDQLFFTTKDIYSYDEANTRFNILTPNYQVGTVKVVNGSAVVRGGLSIDTCDDNPVEWVDGSGGDVTPSRDTGDKQDGTASVLLTVGAGAGVELLAYNDIASVDLSAHDSVGFWIKCSVATNLGDLRFLLDNTSACASPLENLNIPALLANTWTWVSLPFATPGNLTAVISIGIYQAVDLGACTIRLDQIVVGDWLDKLGVGDYFKIGTTGVHTDATWYQVLTVDSDTQITLAAVYAGSTADQQGYTVRQIFQGTTDDIWDSDMFFDVNQGNMLVATNGVDTPVYFLEGGTEFIPFESLPTDMTTAKYIRNFFNRIVFLATVEGGQNLFIRIRWGAVGLYNSYDDLDFNDLDLPSAANIIAGAIIVGDFMIIPKLGLGGIGGAYTMRVSVSENDFDFTYESDFEGNRAPFSLVRHKGGFGYFGTDNRFRYFNILRDEEAFPELTPQFLNADPNETPKICGFRSSFRNQIRWAMPYDSSSAECPMLVYDYENNHAEIWAYKIESQIRSIGEFLTSSTLFVDDPAWAALFVDDEVGFWDDQSFLANAPVTLYGTEDGLVYRADTGDTDDGSDYERIFRLSRQDFKMPHMFKRLAKQQWWLRPQDSGNVTIQCRLDDNVGFEPTTKNISLINSEKDVIKAMIRWNKRFHAADFQIQSTSHFSLLGVLNWLHKRRPTVY